MSRPAAEIRFETFRAIRGFRFGLRQPALLCQIRLSGADRHLQALAAFRADLLPHLPPPDPCYAVDPEAAATPAERLLLQIAELAAQVQFGAGVPVLDRAVADQSANPFLAPGTEQWLLALPAFSHNAAAEALARLMEMFRDHMAGKAPPAEWPARVEDVFQTLEPHAVGKGSNLTMLQMAAARGIPGMRRPDGTFLYGWGEKSQVFKGTMGEPTGLLAATTANDKRRTHLMLRAAGLPMADQHPVPTLQVAKDRAAEMGYPVVLKATDLERGDGVEPDIPDEAALAAGFDRLRRTGRPLLLEKFQPGQIYRVNVLHGSTILTGLRRPAGVIGDGQRDVAALVDATNADPRRGVARFHPLRPLVLDAAAEACLAEQGLTLGDVPEDGRFVYLGKRTNTSAGGLNTVLPEDGLHPDNLWLAERAADVLRLDMAGVDLILPDIARSWRDTGGVICEVNAGPSVGNIFTDVLARLLDRRIAGTGRIHVDLVLGAEAGFVEDLLAAQAAARQPGGQRVLVAGARLHVDGDHVLDCEDDVAAVTAALSHPRSAHLVLVPDPQRVLEQGLMVDRADRIFPGETLPEATRTPLLDQLRPHVGQEIPLTAETRAQILQDLAGPIPQEPRAIHPKG